MSLAVISPSTSTSTRACGTHEAACMHSKACTGSLKTWLDSESHWLQTSNLRLHSASTGLSSKRESPSRPLHTLPSPPPHPPRSLPPNPSALLTHSPPNPPAANGSCRSLTLPSIPAALSSLTLPRDPPAANASCRCLHSLTLPITSLPPSSERVRAAPSPEPFRSPPLRRMVHAALFTLTPNLPSTPAAVDSGCQAMACRR